MKIQIELSDNDLYLISESLEKAQRVTTHDITETAMIQLQDKIDSFLELKEKIKKKNMKPATIRAKFKCDSVIQASYSEDTITAYLSAVYQADGTKNENASFTKYTPSAQLTITINKETPAHLFFERGKEYYLDFSEAK